MNFSLTNIHETITLALDVWQERWDVAVTSRRLLFLFGYQATSELYIGHARSLCLTIFEGSQRIRYQAHTTWFTKRPSLSFRRFRIRIIYCGLFL